MTLTRNKPRHLDFNPYFFYSIKFSSNPLPPWLPLMIEFPGYTLPLDRLHSLGL